MLERVILICALMNAQACGHPVGYGHAGGWPASQAGPCRFSGSELLPGVRIELTKGQLSFDVEAAQRGISISYRVVVKEAITGVIAKTACGAVHNSGLFFFEIIEGNGQRYCDCDQGRCLPNTKERSLKVGVHARSFAWRGRNWNGPSCTLNPKGPPFPPGAYKLRIEAGGTVQKKPFSISLVCPVTLR